MYRDAPFDVQPVREASVEDLDQHLFRDTYLPSAVHASVLEENNRPFEAQMASLRLLDLGPPATPTVLGLLAVGKQPRRFLPMAYVSFLRLAGEQLAAEVMTAHELHGPLPRLIPQLDDLLREHIMTKVDITSGDTERRQPDYPLAALQQLIRNAVLHRSYEGTQAWDRHGNRPQFRYGVDQQAWHDAMGAQSVAQLGAVRFLRRWSRSVLLS